MTKLLELKRRLRPGQVFRREDVARWSNAVDRHLKKVVEDGTLTKLAGGLYAYPKQTVFGKAPAEDDKLVKAFLKDDDFFWLRPTLTTGLGSARRSFTTRPSATITSGTVISYWADAG